MPLQFQSINLCKLQPVAYRSFRAQRTCDFIFQDTLETFFQQGEMCNHHFQFIVADEDSRFCTIIYIKHDDSPNFVVIVVPKTDPAKRFIQIFKKNNQCKLYHIIVEYSKFTREYIFKARMDGDQTYWIFQLIDIKNLQGKEFQTRIYPIDHPLVFSNQFSSYKNPLHHQYQQGLR